MPKAMITTIPVLFASILIGGCQTPQDPYYYTAQEIVFAPTANSAVASDMAAQLRRSFQPAKTTFWMPAAVASKSFGQALDLELRKAGYAIASRAPGIELAYVVDVFGAHEIRVTVVAGEGYQCSRLYAESDTGDLEPEGCFTERSDPQPDPGPTRISPWAVSLPGPRAVVYRPAAASVPIAAAPPKPAAGPAAAAAAPTAKVPGATIADRVAPSLTDPRYSIVAPDSDNVIALNENLFVVPVQTTDNPFLQLYQPPYKPTDSKIVVLAGVGGPTPTCIINGEIFAEGDRVVHGLKVYRIDSDEVYLERGNFLLKCPVSNDGVIIRLPE